MSMSSRVLGLLFGHGRWFHLTSRFLICNLWHSPQFEKLWNVEEERPYDGGNCAKLDVVGKLVRQQPRNGTQLLKYVARYWCINIWFWGLSNHWFECLFERGQNSINFWQLRKDLSHSALKLTLKPLWTTFFLENFSVVLLENFR